MSTAIAEQMTRDQVPVEETWDLSSYYPSDKAWEADLAGARELVDRAAAHRGSLGESPERLATALADVYSANERIERLITYAHLRRDEDLRNSERVAAYDRAVSLAIEAGQRLAFIQPELMQVPEATFAELMQAPELAGYRHVLDDIARRRPHTLSTEIEEILARSYDLARTAPESFSALNDADLDFGTVQDDDGNEVQLTKGRYQLLMRSKNREVRRAAYEALAGEYLAHINTTSTLYASSVRSDIFYATVRNYESPRQAALYGNAIDEAVYDRLLEEVRNATPIIERFLDLRRRILGLDELALYDMYVPLGPQPERTYSIDEAKRIVLDGVKPLGNRYVDDLQSLFERRIVDWHETKGKDSGAYSSSAYGALPVILMNWNGTTDHVFTLTHEAGHAMHSYYASQSQPYHYANYTLFTAEIASTVNEVLLTWELLRTLPEEDLLERFAILDRFTEMIWGTLIRQAMFADFEHQTHQAAQSGQPLTVDSLKAMYGEVCDVYRPGVVNDERAQIEWSRVPHFYRAFYVYQYSTGISAAIALARAMRDGGDEDRLRYLDMLSVGGSDYPIPLLQRAGVDPTTGEPVRAALQTFDETVAEMERIAEAAGFLNDTA
jgi:oligoendopeptidase F